MSEIKLNTTGGSGGSVSLKGPASTTGNADVDFVLPQADGSAGQYLKTDGSKNLSFATVSSVGDGTGVDFNDSVKTRWGTDNDLEMYHDNSNSYIKHANNGSLEIDATNSGHIILKPDGEVKVSNSKNLKIDDGNLVVGTSGHGIDFTATADGSGTDSSSLLDDYEEGTWTPVLKSGSDTITYDSGSYTRFTYTKIGNMVTVWMTLDNRTTSGTTGGAFTVEGLPYAPVDSTGRMTNFSALWWGSGLRLSHYPIATHTLPGNATLEFYYKTAIDANYAAATITNVGSSSYLFVTQTYEVNS